MPPKARLKGRTVKLKPLCSVCRLEVEDADKHYAETGHPTYYTGGAIVYDF